MNLNIYTILGIISLLSVLASGCGGGGDGTTPNPGSGGGTNTPTDTNLDFNLFPANYFASYDVSASLIGSDNQGNTYTGSIAEKTLATVTFLGENSAPIETQIDFTASNGGFASVTQNQYFGTNANDRRFLGVSGDIVTVAATTSTIPPTAKIGDSGTAGTYLNNDNSFTTVTWSLEDGFNGNAKLIFLTSTDNQSGDLDNTATTTYTIEPDGTRLLIELVTFNVNVNLEVTLSGSY